MRHESNIFVVEWFAWHPVKTSDGWVWWKRVEKIIDDKPGHFLRKVITYEKIDEE